MTAGYIMEAFGVRFVVLGDVRFVALRELFAEIKKDKDAGAFRDVTAWQALVPDAIKPRFEWLTDREREEWAAVRDSTVIAVPDPADQLGGVWVFDRVFEAIEESEYTLLSCEMVDDNIAEIQIDPHSYPYGGVGPFIALVEAFGFTVLGVNEYGEYQKREQLLRGR